MKGDKIMKEDTIKLAIVGPMSVGKSSLVEVFWTEEGQPVVFKDSYNSTVGVDLRIKCMRISNRNIKIQLWDTAGQDRYQSFTDSLFNKVNGIIMVFDLSRNSSFHQIKEYMVRLKNMQQIDHRFICLIGNKSIS